VTSPAPPHLVVDWDGTATEQDTLHMLIERFGDLEVYRAAEEAIGRGMTLHDVIAREMRTIRATLPEAVEWLLGHVRLRPGFAELVATHDPLVVSAGFHELIEPVLEAHGLRVRLVANHIDARADRWAATFRSREACTLCGEPCKRDAVRRLDRFAFVGDGISDRCVALAAERVFARAGLARWLDRQGVAYEPFDDFYEVAARL
jgi:2-hydroxy-3-keto-5-methylthiopentenyl-1-phosphate phosphatase